MLPSDDLLRHLPRWFPLVDRLRLETLVFAHDIMEIGLDRLYNGGIGYDVGAPSEMVRISMFSDAWSIVDQIHVVLQIFETITGIDRKADTQMYIDDFGCAHLLRNKMDHINSNMNNIANMKSRSSALFGVLYYFRPCVSTWEQGLRDGKIRGDLIAISAGHVPEECLYDQKFDELNIHLPICSFRLKAFDIEIFVERAVLRLRLLLRRFSDDIEAQVRSKAIEIAEKTNLTLDEVLVSGSERIDIRFDLELMITCHD